jgi:hypothetical protein
MKIYAIFNPETKGYLTCSGYYGNEINIHVFASKQDAEKYIKMFYRDTNFKVKSIKING